MGKMIETNQDYRSAIEEAYSHRLGKRRKKELLNLLLEFKSKVALRADQYQGLNPAITHLQTEQPKWWTRPVGIFLLGIIASLAATAIWQIYFN
tara:strand:- start:1597 stop:1878 length:282 start_codon:yes stop_codon:yes gene_type:complete